MDCVVHCAPEFDAALIGTAMSRIAQMLSQY
jgi:hypothetical protein